jgi:hypothetical protein
MKKPAKIGKRVNLTVRKEPKARVARTPKFSHTKYHGQEPAGSVTITDPADSRFIAAMNWYNYFYDADEAKVWLVDYMTSQNAYGDAQIRRVKAAPTWKLPRTLGTIGMMMSVKGWVLPMEVRLRHADRIASVLKELEEERVVADTLIVRAPVNPQERVVARAKTIAYGMLDEHIDLFYSDNAYRAPLYDVLVALKPSPQAVTMMRDKIEAHLAELGLEGYDALTKKQIIAYKAFFGGLSSDLDRFSANKKATKAPPKARVVKEKPAEKLVAKVKFQKDFAPLKLVSIPPAQIVKAKSLWVYNTKYKQLTVYHAVDDKGLGIKGTTITNFDTASSMTKRLGWKVEETLQAVLARGKIAVRKIMSEDLKKLSPMVAKGRLNENSILLRVIHA